MCFCSREVAIDFLSEHLDNLILSDEESSDETEDYDEAPPPQCMSRRPRRLRRSHHIDIRNFFAPGTFTKKFVFCLNCQFMQLKVYFVF